MRFSFGEIASLSWRNGGTNPAEKAVRKSSKEGNHLENRQSPDKTDNVDKIGVK